METNVLPTGVPWTFRSFNASIKQFVEEPTQKNARFLKKRANKAKTFAEIMLEEQDKKASFMMFSFLLHVFEEWNKVVRFIEQMSHAPSASDVARLKYLWTKCPLVSNLKSLEEQSEILQPIFSRCLHVLFAMDIHSFTVGATSEVQITSVAGPALEKKPEISFEEITDQCVSFQRQIKAYLQNPVKGDATSLKKEAKETFLLLHGMMEQEEKNDSYVMMTLLSHFFESWRPLLKHIQTLQLKPPKRQLDQLKQLWIASPRVPQLKAASCDALQKDIQQEIYPAEVADEEKYWDETMIKVRANPDILNHDNPNPYKSVDEAPDIVPAIPERVKKVSSTEVLKNIFGAEEGSSTVEKSRSWDEICLESNRQLENIIKDKYIGGLVLKKDPTYKCLPSIGGKAGCLAFVPESLRQKSKPKTSSEKKAGKEDLSAEKKKKEKHKKKGLPPK
jgi:hypothetical protein